MTVEDAWSYVCWGSRPEWSPVHRPDNCRVSLQYGPSGGAVILLGTCTGYRRFHTPGALQMYPPWLYSRIFVECGQKLMTGFCLEQRENVSMEIKHCVVSLLCTWRMFGSLATCKMHSEDSDRTGRMSRLTWVFTGRSGHFGGFVTGGPAVQPGMYRGYHRFHTVGGLQMYLKFPKYSDTQKICCNHSKIWTLWLYHRVMSPNDADGMANSVGPDQTDPLGGSALFAQTCLSENLGKLRYLPCLFVEYGLKPTGSTLE